MLNLAYAVLLLTDISLAAYVVPLPSGPYGVSIQDVLITDHDVPDPYLNLSYRRVPASIISQTGSSVDCEPVLRQYMPNTTAIFWEKAFTSQYGIPFSQTFTETQLITCKPKESWDPAPVVLFAPAAGISRYFYHVLASMIAAQTGYTVITFDIPGQTEIEVFPDGSVENQAKLIDDVTFTNDEAVGNVTQSAIIVLDALFSNSTGNNLTTSPPLPMALRKTRQAAIVGHSQGGSAALVALVADSRLSSGANLDGGLNDTAFSYLASPSSPNYTTKKPFAFFEHQGFNQSSVFSWPIVWADVLRGTKWQFQLNGTQHDSYSDFPYLVDLYGIRQKANVSSKAVDSVMGTIPGSTVLEVVKDVLSAFFAYGFGQESAASVVQHGQQFESWGFGIVNQTIVTS